ncbi:MAG TPA: PIN domain-containing protein [Steroidobacteraceae bacterium]
MADSVLLVDYENIGKMDLGAIPPGVRVPFFFGASQKSVPTEFLKAALKLGERFVPIDIEGQGKNALDFHIAFYLGEYLARSPQTPCVIFSRDKGFDPLIKHLVKRGFAVRRANSIAEALASATPAAVSVSPQTSTLWDNALSLLAGAQKSRRPRKRKSLVAYLHSHFSQKIPEAELQRLVDQMIAREKLSEVKGSITYHF